MAYAGHPPNHWDSKTYIPREDIERSATIWGVTDGIRLSFPLHVLYALTINYCIFSHVVGLGQSNLVPTQHTNSAG